MSNSTASFEGILPAIARRATPLDQSGQWPADDLADLKRAGAFRWAVATDFGGDGVEPVELHLRYQRLAAASLSTALVLTQRDSGIGLIEGAENGGLRERLLPALAEGEFFVTIGIAQLTTSRHGGLTATPVAGGYRLNGTIPWSTGPAHCRYVVAGAIVDDCSGQILFALPTDARGVRIRDSMPLVALRSSCTTSIDCDNVLLESQWVLRGPAPNVLSGRKKGVGVSQAFLALGLCAAGIELIRHHDSLRGAELERRFSEQFAPLQSRVVELPESQAGVGGPILRGECNDLALRITHSAVALYKGHALLADHPAQRLAREALFLLVWSCPDPVIECTVDILSSARSES